MSGTSRRRRAFRASVLGIDEIRYFGDLAADGLSIPPHGVRGVGLPQPHPYLRRTVRRGLH
jgi:hypothetical protein